MAAPITTQIVCELFEYFLCFKARLQNLKMAEEVGRKLKRSQNTQNAPERDCLAYVCMMESSIYNESQEKNSIST